MRLSVSFCQSELIRNRIRDQESGFDSGSYRATCTSATCRTGVLQQVTVAIDLYVEPHRTIGHINKMGINIIKIKVNIE